MAVRQIKSNPRCKLCATQYRAEIDALLEMRSLGQETEQGERVTLDFVLSAAAAWGVSNPTKDNVTGHFKNHCQMVDDDVVDLINAEQSQALALLEAGDKVDPDVALDRIVALGMAEIEAKVKSGQKTGIPPDLVLKAIQVKTQRKSSEAQSTLLQALGQGIAAHMGGGGVVGAGEVHEIEEPIEAEFTEDEA